MGANYKLVRNPNPKGDDTKQPLHARVVPYGTIGIEELMATAQGRSTFTSADIKGALQLISDLLAERLEEGYNVELPGIGFFSVSLDARPVMEKNEIRSQSVHFKNVNFRCSKRLKERLKCMPLTRAEEHKQEEIPADIREKKLMAYLNSHPFITSSEYMGLAQCTKYGALKDLSRFAEEGKIEMGGYRSTRVYFLPKKESPME